MANRIVSALVVSAAAFLAAPLTATASAGGAGIHKIRHVVIIMQENRSFDSYFGTYPGADGIPGLDGNPGKVPCVPDLMRRRCRKPYHNHKDVNAGGPHMAVDALTDIDNGKMNGFIASVETGHVDTDRLACHVPITTAKQLVAVLSGPPCLDVMGYHDAREIPQLLGLRAELRAPGPHVRAEPRLEPALSRVHGVRLVCHLPERDAADELQDRESGPAGRRRATAKRGKRRGAARPDQNLRHATIRLPPPRRPTTDGPISLTCCTSTTSAGAIT